MRYFIDYPDSPKLRRHRAFTLIELLSAVAIVGILISIVVVSISKVRNSAHAAQCASNLRQIHTAIHLYANDHGGQLPGPFYMGHGPRYYYSANSGTVTPGSMSGRLHNYLPGAKPDPAAGSGRWFQPVFACPGWLAKNGANTPSANSNVATSYALNLTPWPGNQIISGGSTFSPLGDLSNSRQPLSLQELSPLPLSRTWMIVDADSPFFAKAMGWGSSPNYLSTSAHGEERNVLFFDGHVEGRTPERFPHRLN